MCSVSTAKWYPRISSLQLGWLFGSAVLLVARCSSPASAQTVLVSEPFQGNSTTGWIVSNFNPYDPTKALPCLTARSPNDQTPSDIAGCPGGAIDPVGSGVLRLTPNRNNEAGFVLNQNAVGSKDGLVVLFDLYSYGGSGADGVSFFLINGSTPVTDAGAFGGSLGYAQRNARGIQENGLNGGYAGLGIDEFGNYSNPNEGRIGGPGPIPNAVAIRGSGQGFTGYQYLIGTGPLQPQFDFPNASSRAQATARRVRITLTPDNKISADVDFFDGRGFVPIIGQYNLAQAPGQAPLPATFKFGFAASTGDGTNIHEVRAFLLTTVPPDLSISKSHTGDFSVGQEGVYTLKVTNSPSGGSTTGPITVTDTLPAGFSFVSATGTNWSCSANGQVVTCTYNGTPIGPGGSLPDLTLRVNVTDTAVPGVVTNTSQVSTPGDDPTAPNADQKRTANNTTSDKTTIIGKANLRLVKRITAVTRGGVPLGGVDFNAFINDPQDPNDDAPGFAQLQPVGVSQISSETPLQSGDEVEYTIYFLSDGSSPANGVNFCDAIPTGTTFIRDSFGAEQGILLNAAGTTTAQTNALDADSGSFFSPLAPLPTGHACSDPTNPQGAVIINIPNVSNSPNNNVGFIRFRVRIK
jgi:uncharacterized repeat protein (TIGR01451 family)